MNIIDIKNQTTVAVQQADVIPMASDMHQGSQK